jgi:membrane fusion protein, multidrug efflux system
MNKMSRVVSENDAPINASTRQPKSRLWLMLSVPLIIAATGLYFWLTSGKTVSTDNATIGAPSASIAPEVSGRIVEVRVSENSIVNAGDLLFRIDPAPFRIAELQAEAQLGTARVQVAQLESTASAKTADVSTKAADIGAATANLELAQENFARQDALLKRGFTTRASFDAARAAVVAARQAQSAATAERQSAQASAAAAQAALGTGVNGLPPAVAAAQASLERARLDLSRTEIHAPIGGRVTSADRLQTGNMATLTLPILNIVSNQGYWIEANFKETQLSKIRIGQHARIVIDAMPGREFDAQVTGIGAGTGSEFSLLPAQNATGNWVKVTQRVPVRLTFVEKPDRPLVAGWSAKVTVRVDD